LSESLNASKAALALTICNWGCNGINFCS
jgi:hypothetical protein